MIALPDTKFHDFHIKRLFNDLQYLAIWGHICTYICMYVCTCTWGHYMYIYVCTWGHICMYTWGKNLSACALTNFKHFFWVLLSIYKAELVLALYNISALKHLMSPFKHTNGKSFVQFTHSPVERLFSIAGVRPERYHWSPYTM